MLAGDDNARTLSVDRQPVAQPRQGRALHTRCENNVARPSGHRRNTLHECFGEHEHFIADLHANVVRILRERDRHVGGQRPRGGGPDKNRHRQTLGSPWLGRIPKAELDVDAVRGLVSVLDLRLGECGLAAIAPVDRLRALVHHAPAVHLGEHLHVAGLVLRLQREVRVPEVAAHAETFELRCLDAHEAHRVLATQRTEIRLRRLLHALRAEVLLHLVFDRLTVAVPTGYVGRVVPAHGLVLHDEVLQDLVERRPHVDVAVGIRRPIVEHEHGAIGTRLERAAVDIDLIPEPQPLGLPRGQAGPHRELRLRQVHRALVVDRVGHPRASSHTTRRRRRPKRTKRARPHLGRSAPPVRSHSAVPPSLRQNPV